MLAGNNHSLLSNHKSTSTTKINVNFSGDLWTDINSGKNLDHDESDMSVKDLKVRNHRKTSAIIDLTTTESATIAENIGMFKVTNTELNNFWVT